MNLPGYDTWKLANPHDLTPEAEQEIEARDTEQAENLRDAISAALSDERGDLYLSEVRRIVIEALNNLRPLPGEPRWQTATPVPVPPLG